MRRPDDSPALRARLDEGCPDDTSPTEDGVDASTPESRRLHALLLQLGRHHSLKNPVASICEELQLTPTQFHALGWLGNDGPVQVGMLAQRVGITRKTITGVVDRLETMGLVERTRDSEDRRAVVVRLTVRGEENFRRINRSVDAGMRRLLGLMDASDQAAFFGLLERMVARMGAEAQGGPGTAPTG
jgi:DNA-binding MarR family transcriptional regulator